MSCHWRKLCPITLYCKIDNNNDDDDDVTRIAQYVAPYFIVWQFLLVSDNRTHTSGYYVYTSVSSFLYFWTV